jgi:hypothetical protein
MASRLEPDKLQERRKESCGHTAARPACIETRLAHRITQTRAYASLVLTVRLLGLVTCGMARIDYAVWVSMTRFGQCADAITYESHTNQ